MAHELDVWLFEGRVGTLALVDGRLSFCYAPGWLSLPNAVALSALAGRTHGGAQTADTADRGNHVWVTATTRF